MGYVIAVVAIGIAVLSYTPYLSAHLEIVSGRNLLLLPVFCLALGHGKIAYDTIVGSLHSCFDSFVKESYDAQLKEKEKLSTSLVEDPDYSDFPDLEDPLKPFRF